MRPDGEGFLYPAVDAAKCVDCGLCEKVCPIKEGERWKAEREPRCFAAIHKSDGVLMRSTSGERSPPSRTSYSRAAAQILTKICASSTK